MPARVVAQDGHQIGRDSLGTDHLVELVLGECLVIAVDVGDRFQQVDQLHSNLLVPRL